LAPNTDISSDLVHVFSMDISSGAPDGDSINFSGDIKNLGTATINVVAVGDVFNIAYGNGVKTLLEAFLLSGGLLFDISNNTQGGLFAACAGGVGSKQTVEGQHEGSISYSAPEPASSVILGFAGACRRKV
jgi:hypothetical protein